MARNFVFTLTTILLLPFSLIAQEPKLSLGFKASPGHNIRMWRPSYGYVGAAPQFGFRVGGDVRILWGNGLFMESGIELAQFSWGTDWRPLILPCDPGTSDVFIRVRRTDYIIGFPIGIGYQYRPGRFGLSIALGGTFNYPNTFSRTVFKVNGDSCDPVIGQEFDSGLDFTSAILSVNPYINLDLLIKVLPTIDFTTGLSVQSMFIAAYPGVMNYQQNDFHINPAVSVGIRIKVEKE